MEKSEGLTKSQVREKLYRKLMKCTKKAIVEHENESLKLWAVVKNSRFAVKLSAGGEEPDFAEAFVADVVETVNARSSYVRNYELPANIEFVNDAVE